MPGLEIARVDRKKTASIARSTKRKLDFKGSLIVGGGALTAALLLQSSLERRSENAGERGRGSRREADGSDDTRRLASVHPFPYTLLLFYY